MPHFSTGRLFLETVRLNFLAIDRLIFRSKYHCPTVTKKNVSDEFLINSLIVLYIHVKYNKVINTLQQSIIEDEKVEPILLYTLIML